MLSAIRFQVSRTSLRQFSTSSPAFVKTLYVGNLSWNIKEDQMRSIFEEFGEVNSAKIIMDRISARSRGFGFVEFVEDDAAKNAIEELNGKEVEGRALTVNESQPREPRGDSGYGGERRSYGGNRDGGRGGGRGYNSSFNDRGGDRFSGRGRDY